MIRAVQPYSLFGAGAGPVGAPADAVEPRTVAMLRSIREVPTPLNTAFFGSQNVDAIQRELVAVLRARLGVEISRQSDEQLLIVMRSVYARESSNRTTGVPAEVHRLNGLVLAETVPIVGANLRQHLTYLRDASRLPEPIPRGLQTSVRGDKTVSLFRPL
jgi:hypothetical protein